MEDLAWHEDVDHDRIFRMAERIDDRSCNTTIHAFGRRTNIARPRKPARKIHPRIGSHQKRSGMIGRSSGLLRDDLTKLFNNGRCHGRSLCERTKHVLQDAPVEVILTFRRSIDTHDHAEGDLLS